MREGLRRFFHDLLHGATPINDLRTDAAPGAREENAARLARLLSHTGGDGAAQDLATRAHEKNRGG